MKKGEEACISVRKLPNLQVEYAGTVVLAHVTFAVQPSGLKRYRATGQKNVHAYVRGTLVDSSVNHQPKPGWLVKEAYYNPSTCDTFIDKATGAPLTKARAAWMVGNKVWYTP